MEPSLQLLKISFPYACSSAEILGHRLALDIEAPFSNSYTFSLAPSRPFPLMQFPCYLSLLTRTTSLFTCLEKLTLNFSSWSFAICVSLLHPLPHLLLYGLLFSLWYFSTLVQIIFRFPSIER